jgi:hypothetical protein
LRFDKSLRRLSSKSKDRTAEHEKRVKIIQQKLDRLDEAFLFAEHRRDELRTATGMSTRF